MPKPPQPSSAAKATKAHQNRTRHGSLYRPDEWKYSLAAVVVLAIVFAIMYLVAG